MAEAWTEFCVLLFEAGPELSLDDAARLERELVEHPSSLETRARLMGFYLAKSREVARTTDAVDPKEAFHAHHVWVVQHAPATGLAEALTLWIHCSSSERERFEMMEAWEQHARSDSVDPALFGNAARFLWINDRADAAVHCLRHAIELAPEDPRWAEELAQHLLEDARSNRRQTTADQFAEIHRYLDFALRRTTHPMRQEDLLQPLLVTSVLAEKLEAAASFANSILLRRFDEVDTDACQFLFHQAHLALGHIAMTQDRPDVAAGHFAEAAGSHSRHPLNEFLLEAQLSEQMLARGWRMLVESYWRARASLYGTANLEGRRIQDWLAALNAGSVPEFRLVG